MSTGSNNREIERSANEWVGDEVVLKLHTGDPGPDLTDNLADGTGWPVVRRRSDTGPVTFHATHQADSDDRKVLNYYVTMWKDGAAAGVLSSDQYRHPSGVRYGAFPLAPGDTITIRDFPHIRVHS